MVVSTVQMSLTKNYFPRHGEKPIQFTNLQGIDDKRNRCAAQLTFTRFIHSGSTLLDEIKGIRDVAQ